MRILLLGTNGQLGKELERQLSSVANVAAFPRESLDITNHTAVRYAVRCVRPDIIVNAAAYTAVDKAETNADFVHAINADAVANLAQIAREQSLWLIHYSTDYVFDSSKQSPYFETDTPNPINVYGESKLAGDKAIAAANCQHLIFRTPWVIGEGGYNFANTILRLARERDVLQVVHDQIGVTTSKRLIARVTIDAIRAIRDNSAWQQGIYNLAPRGKTSRHEIAQTLVAYAKQQHIPLRTHPSEIQAITTAEYPTAAKRPLNSQLDTSKLRAQLSFELPHWKDDCLAVAGDIVKEGAL